jgi:hypothetical protein
MVENVLSLRYTQISFYIRANIKNIQNHLKLCLQTSINHLKLFQKPLKLYLFHLFLLIDNYIRFRENEERLFSL